MTSFKQFTGRFFTALVLGSIAPTAALAASPAPVVTPAAPAATALALVDAVIATSVDARKPVGAAATFDGSSGALFAYVKVKNLGTPTTITMVWKKEGKKRLAVALQVGHSIGWATWSKKGIGPKDTGHWTVDVLDADGVLVDTLAFTVSGATSVGSK